MRRGLAVLLLAMVALFALATRQKVPGVWSTHLLGRCELVHYTRASEQPERTITLDCPGIDSIRLWPLPPAQPWHEDPLRQPGERIGSLALPATKEARPPSGRLALHGFVRAQLALCFAQLALKRG